MDTSSIRETSVSMDDPDVRLAAEALSGLGNPGMWGSGALMAKSKHILTTGYRLCPFSHGTIPHIVCPLTHC